MRSNTKSSIAGRASRRHRAEALREAYRKASRVTRASLARELRELGHLVAEGLPES